MLTLSISSGLRLVEKPRGLAVDEGVSGYRWERWVRALWQGLLAGGGNISTMKCSVKTRFSGEPILLVPDSLRSGARTPPGIRELNLQTFPPPHAPEKLVTALTICGGLTDAWKLHTSPSYEENGFSSPVLLRGAGINETLTLRHLFRPCQLCTGICRTRGFGGTCRCSPTLREPLPVVPCVPMMTQPRCAPSTGALAPLTPQHHPLHGAALSEQPWQTPQVPGDEASPRREMPSSFPKGCKHPRAGSLLCCRRSHSS